MEAEEFESWVWGVGAMGDWGMVMTLQFRP